MPDALSRIQLIHAECSCGARTAVERLGRAHLCTFDPEFPLIGGNCPRCGSTRYVPLCSVPIDQLAMVPGLELIWTSTGPAVVRAEDVDAMEDAA
jgi:hypothetical protein